MGDNEDEDIIVEIVDQVGEGVQSIAEQIPGLSKRVDAITSKFNEARPKIAKGMKLTADICR